MGIIQKTIEFANKAHRGQFRKYTNEPYIVHPFSVAGLVSSITNNPNMICASLLHDIVEDTNITIKDIFDNFGEEISLFVFGMTDQSKLEDGNRKFRKKLYKEHLTNKCENVKTIKLADMIDNMKTIPFYDPNFAKIYMKENRDLISILQEGDKSLYDIAKTMINNYFDSLEKGNKYIYDISKTMINDYFNNLEKKN